PELNVISNIKVDGMPIGGLGDGEAIWHADMTYVEQPPMGAILYALEIPPAATPTGRISASPTRRCLPTSRVASRDAAPCTMRPTTAPASSARAMKTSPIRARRQAHGTSWC